MRLKKRQRNKGLNRTQLYKKRNGNCTTLGCRGDLGNDRNVCHKCTKRKYAQKYPVKQAYYNLRGNARRRGKHFSITLQDFIDFCNETKYMELKGRSKTKASIDRKKSHLGYIPGNLQILTLSENGTKGNEEKNCPF